jgi:pseudouridine-5'-phosphate glycosidase
MRIRLGVDGGMLVANPVPEANEIPRAEMESYIEAALQRADAQGISGKEVTPFLLGEILSLTGGRSLETNIALVRNNARLAAEIAVGQPD